MSHNLAKNTLHSYKPCSLYITVLKGKIEILLNKREQLKKIPLIWLKSTSQTKKKKAEKCKTKIIFSLLIVQLIFSVLDLLAVCSGDGDAVTTAAIAKADMKAG